MTVLRDVAHCRAGDKGDCSILVIVPFRRDDFEKLADAVTPEAVAHTLRLTAGVVPRVQRFGHLGGLVVVIPTLLGGGVTRSGRADPHGKTVAGLLLALPIVPTSGR